MQEENNRKSINSAIGSWSGYIYQGLCAVYVVLTYLLDELTCEEKKVKYKDYIFYLDSFDDFSIHKGNNIAISLHQCKVYKENVGFLKDQEQLLEQKKILQELSICDENTKLYFHANSKIQKKEGVIQYVYKDGLSLYGPKDITEGIYSIVAEIIKKAQIARSKESVCNALYNLIDSKVQEIHQRFLEGKHRLCDLARNRDSAITFQKVRNIIYIDNLENCQKDEFWLLTKFAFMRTINKLIEENKTIEDWEDINPEFVFKFLYSIGKMDEQEFFELIKRIIPCEEKNMDTSSVTNLTNTSIVTGILNVVGKSNLEISEDLDWNKNGQHQTPSTSRQDSIRKICQALYAQRNNLDCLREYDWLIHDKNHLEKVDNCWDKIINIIEVDNSDKSNDIFKEKAIGLMSINNFNSENND